MTPTARTVTLPINPGASWDDFAWDPKYPSDDLDYTLDCADWLASAGRAIETASVSVSSDLTVVDLEFCQSGGTTTGVMLQLTGGTALTVEQVAIALALDSGRTLTVLVALPIRAGLPIGLVPYLPYSAGDATGIAIGLLGLNA